MHRLRHVRPGSNNSVGWYPAEGIGPTAEGFIVFLVGVTALIGIALRVGARS